jgi:hypothetical protein
MATLFNTKISQTYEGLLKTIDNGVITATLKELTDGSGNQSGLLLNTAGDFKVTSVLEWGSLKDTGTGVTITQFVTAANGIENFNNDTTLPTSAAVKLYVDTKFSQTDTLTEVLGFGNTTSGKDIAVSAGDDVTFTDTSKAIFGTSSEFEIFQDTADSRITTLSNLYIQTPIFRVQKTGGESMIQAFTDGAVQLFFNGVKKIETTLLGSTVTGDLLVTGTITGAGGSFLPLAGGIMTGNTIHNDNVKSIYGTASDGLEIFHDSNNSFIKDTGTGVFNIQGSTQVNIGSVNGQIGFQFVEGANTAMRHANVTKLSTESTGIAVTGALSTTSNVTVGANATFVDNGKAIFGAGSDLSIYHNSTNSYLDNDNGDLYIRNNFQDRDIILQSDNGGGGIATYIQIDGSTGKVELSHYGTKRLETVSDGAKVTGNLEVTGTITGAGGSFLPLIGGTMTGDTIHNDNVKSIYGTGSDLEIFHSGTNSEINNSTGGLLIKTNTFRVLNAAGTEQMLRADTDDAVQLYFNNVVRLATTNTGIAVTGGGSFTGNVEVGANNINFANNGKARFGNQANLQIYSDGSNSFIDNTGGTQSTIFKTSNNSPLDTTALIINRSGDLITGNDVTIAGDLTVNGTTTTVNSQTLSVVDPLISLATANAANSLDIGFYGKYNDGTPRYLGLYNDASDSNKFKLFKNTTVEPTTVVSQAGGYQAADLVVAGLESSSFVSTGTVSATSFISTTDVGIDINGIALTRVAANSAIRVGDGLETLGLLRSYSNLIVATTGTFGGDVSVEDNLYLTDSGTNRAKIQLNSSDRDDLDIIAVSLGSNMKFFTVDSERMRITSAGNVGINKTNPDAKLEIAHSLTGVPANNNINLKVTDINTSYAADAGGSIMFSGIYDTKISSNIKSIVSYTLGDFLFISIESIFLCASYCVLTLPHAIK